MASLWAHYLAQFGLLLILVFLVEAAPVADEENYELQTQEPFTDGCYYNYQHYEEGDRIVTNEPCLNCTCHNHMLMCYLRVCPFTKAFGQDCKVEKKPDQCCPVITCPQVPVQLLTSSTTLPPTTTNTAVGRPDNYGCIFDDNKFYPDGAQVPSDSRKPCELCYCIRNSTACVMQECTLNVDGCTPVYQDGICCPVRYDCNYEEETLTTVKPTSGLILTTSSGAPTDCIHDGEIYHDGERLSMSEKNPCEHCYCMRGDIVCAVQECGSPLEGNNCTPIPPNKDQCCPTTFHCANETLASNPTLSDVKDKDTKPNELEPIENDRINEEEISQEDNFIQSTEGHIDEKFDSSTEVLTEQEVSNDSVQPASSTENIESVVTEIGSNPSINDISVENSVVSNDDDKYNSNSDDKQEEVEQIVPDNVLITHDNNSEIKPVYETPVQENISNEEVHERPTLHMPNKDSTSETFNEEEINPESMSHPYIPSHETHNDEVPISQTPVQESVNGEIPISEFPVHDTATKETIGQEEPENEAVNSEISLEENNTTEKISQETTSKYTENYIVESEKPIQILSTDIKPENEHGQSFEESVNQILSGTAMNNTLVDNIPPEESSHQPSPTNEGQLPNGIPSFTEKFEKIDESSEKYSEISSINQQETVISDSHEIGEDDKHTTQQNSESIDSDSSMESQKPVVHDSQQSGEEETSNEESNENQSSNNAEETYTEVSVENVEVHTSIPDQHSHISTNIHDDHEVTTSQIIEVTEHQEPKPTSHDVQSSFGPIEVIESHETPVVDDSESSKDNKEELITTISPTHIPETTSKPSRVPGEGSCLLEGITYPHNSNIPTSNPCQISCQCMSSIISCKLVDCPVPPPYYVNCMPHVEPDSCCPTYTCEEERPTVPLESHSHVSTEQEALNTESPTELSPAEDDNHAVPEQITPNDVVNSVVAIHDAFEATLDQNNNKPTNSIGQDKTELSSDDELPSTNEQENIQSSFETNPNTDNTVETQQIQDLITQIFEHESAPKEPEIIESDVNKQEENQHQSILNNEQNLNNIGNNHQAEEVSTSEKVDSTTVVTSVSSQNNFPDSSNLDDSVMTIIGGVGDDQPSIDSSSSEITNDDIVNHLFNLLNEQNNQDNIIAHEPSHTVEISKPENEISSTNTPIIQDTVNQTESIEVSHTNSDSLSTNGENDVSIISESDEGINTIIPDSQPEYSQSIINTELLGHDNHHTDAQNQNTVPETTEKISSINANQTVTSIDDNISTINNVDHKLETTEEPLKEFENKVSGTETPIKQTESTEHVFENSILSDTKEKEPTYIVEGKPILTTDVVNSSDDILPTIDREIEKNNKEQLPNVSDSNQGQLPSTDNFSHNEVIENNPSESPSQENTDAQNINESILPTVVVNDNNVGNIIDNTNVKPEISNDDKVANTQIAESENRPTEIKPEEQGNFDPNNNDNIEPIVIEHVDQNQHIPIESDSHMTEASVENVQNPDLGDHSGIQSIDNPTPVIAETDFDSNANKPSNENIPSSNINSETNLNINDVTGTNDNAEDNSLPTKIDDEIEDNLQNSEMQESDNKDQKPIKDVASDGSHETIIETSSENAQLTTEIETEVNILHETSVTHEINENENQIINHGEHQNEILESGTNIHKPEESNQHEKPNEPNHIQVENVFETNSPAEDKDVLNNDNIQEEITTQNIIFHEETENINILNKDEDSVPLVTNDDLNEVDHTPDQKPTKQEQNHLLNPDINLNEVSTLHQGISENNDDNVSEEHNENTEDIHSSPEDNESIVESQQISGDNVNINQIDHSQSANNNQLITTSESDHHISNGHESVDKIPPQELEEQNIESKPSDNDYGITTTDRAQFSENNVHNNEQSEYDNSQIVVDHEKPNEESQNISQEHIDHNKVPSDIEIPDVAVINIHEQETPSIDDLNQGNNHPEVQTEYILDVHSNLETEQHSEEHSENVPEEQQVEEHSENTLEEQHSEVHSENAPEEHQIGEHAENVPEGQLVEDQSQIIPEEQQIGGHKENIPEGQLVEDQSQIIPEEQQIGGHKENIPEGQLVEDQSQIIPEEQQIGGHKENIPEGQLVEDQSQIIPEEQQIGGHKENIPEEHIENQSQNILDEQQIMEHEENVQGEHHGEDESQNIPEEQQIEEHEENIPEEQYGEDQSQNIPEAQQVDEHPENKPEDQHVVDQSENSNIPEGHVPEDIANIEDDTLVNIEGGDHQSVANENLNKPEDHEESVIEDQNIQDQTVDSENNSAPELNLDVESEVPDKINEGDSLKPVAVEENLNVESAAPHKEKDPNINKKPELSLPEIFNLASPSVGDSTHVVDQAEHDNTYHELPNVDYHLETTSKIFEESPKPITEKPHIVTHVEHPVFPPTWTHKPFDTVTTTKQPLAEEQYPSGFESDYDEEEGGNYSPGTCRYGGKVYLSAQQIPRDDPCDFCFCFRSDIICLQQSCPPPIKGCHQETIPGFCCPRYECHVSMATLVNVTTTTTTTTTTLPPHFLPHAYRGGVSRTGCQVKGAAYKVGERIASTSGPCLECRCGADGQMKCDPTICAPQEALLRQVMDATAISKRKRR